jgi:hypothetical protein
MTYTPPSGKEAGSPAAPALTKPGRHSGCDTFSGAQDSPGNAQLVLVLWLLHWRRGQGPTAELWAGMPETQLPLYVAVSQVMYTVSVTSRIFKQVPSMVGMDAVCGLAYCQSCHV